MITATATVDDADVTITCDDRPNPLVTTPLITAMIDGVPVAVNVQYRQISSITHSDACIEATSWKCTCAPILADSAPLFAAAKKIVLQYWDARNAADVARPYPLTDQSLRMIEDLYCCPSKANGGPCTCC